MKSLIKFAAPVVFLALGACATPFNARVSRFQQLPVPQGQTFAIVSDDPRMNGSLEFRQYARLVEDRLARVGYAPATAAGTANLVVKIDYGVDGGREKIRSAPNAGFGFGYGFGGFRSGFGRFGYGGFGHPYNGFGNRAFLNGFYDPFLFDNFNSIESYTVFMSSLNMTIERRGSGERVFEGRAQAMSTDNDLTTLVPNLIEAMFTNFPGNSGEVVKITVAPPGKKRR